MPLFGAHLSIAGGLYKAVEAAVTLGMDAVQIFTYSPSQWAVKPITPAAKGGIPWNAFELTEDATRLFLRTRKASGVKVAIAHDSYLINLASPDEGLYRRSIEAFVMEVARADQLGLRYLVTHPGAATDGNEAAGLRRVALALDEVHQRCPAAKVQVLLETTAGQGTSLGHRFEHLASILEQVQEPKRLGVCLDTCHVFAAGYALAPEPEYRATMKEFDRLIGLARIKCFHLNDSKKDCGSRVDRHAHIGRGFLGLEPFRLLVNDPRFRTRPMILETPKEDAESEEMDKVNLALLRGLVKKQ